MRRFASAFIVAGVTVVGTVSPLQALTVPQMNANERPISVQTAPPMPPMISMTELLFSGARCCWRSPVTCKCPIIIF